MAQRRMFNLKVIDTDAFCEMPSSAQNLYFHIGMRADDEGFYAGVKGLMAKVHASIDDLNVLLARHYILDRGDGVYVVKHWKMNNYLQNDRIKPTEYEEKRAGLYTKKDGSYTLDPEKSAVPIPMKKPMDTDCIQNVSIVKSSIEESSLDIDENSLEEDRLSTEETNNGRKYKYTREQIKSNPRVAEECVAMRNARKRGLKLSDDWIATLEDFADEIEGYEDSKPF